MQVTLSRVVEAARQRKAAVTAEAGGYIILLAVQRLAPQPRHIDAELIQLVPTGEILIDGSGAAPAADAEAQLRHLLATLVSLSHTAPPALRAAAERPATGSLAALESELTAALIPINHAASGRALARLFRETEKALRGSATSSLAPSTTTLSAETPSTATPSAVTPSTATLSGETPNTATPSAVTPSTATLSGETPSAAKPSTPLPMAPPAPQPTPCSAPGFQPVTTPADTSELDIDVEVVAGDDEDDPAAMPGSRGPALELWTAPAAAVVRSDAPQLIVEELDDLDVQELDAEEDEAERRTLVEQQPAAVVVPAMPDEFAVLGREDQEHPAGFAEADDLDMLLAGDLPALAPALTEQPRLGRSPLSGEVSVQDVTASPPPASSLRQVRAEPPAPRSDVRELLAGFLAHTRCEEEMAANLRRMVGLEPWRSRGAVDGPPLVLPETSGDPP